MLPLIFLKKVITKDFRVKGINSEKKLSRMLIYRKKSFLKLVFLRKFMRNDSIGDFNKKSFDLRPII